MRFHHFVSTGFELSYLATIVVMIITTIAFVVMIPWLSMMVLLVFEATYGVLRVFMILKMFKNLYEDDTEEILIKSSLAMSVIIWAVLYPATKNIGISMVSDFSSFLILVVMVTFVYSD